MANVVTTRTVAALVALAAAGLITLPTSASAGGRPSCSVAHNVGMRQPGAVAVGRIAVGALAASAMSRGPATSSGECFIERRPVEDEEGNVYVRRVCG